MRQFEFEFEFEFEFVWLVLDVHKKKWVFRYIERLMV